MYTFLVVYSIFRVLAVPQLYKNQTVLNRNFNLKINGANRGLNSPQRVPTDNSMHNVCARGTDNMPSISLCIYAVCIWFAGYTHTHSPAACLCFIFFHHMLLTCV